MFPRKLRSLRCLATFVVILFLFGCMTAILNITNVTNLEVRGVALFEPNEGGHPKHDSDVLDSEGYHHPEHDSDKANAFHNNGHRRDVAGLPKLKASPAAIGNPKAPKIEQKQQRAVESIRQNLHNATERKVGLKRNLDRMPERKTKKKKVVRLSFLTEDALKDTRDWRDVPPNYAIHAFYYPWYGNPENDRSFLHWNHEYLPHWNKEMAKKWPTGVHQPPDDIGSNFYPQLGCYSSKDESVIAEHMRQMRFAGIGVLVISWYPPGQADEQGKQSDKLVSRIMDIANDHDMKVAFHSEPYKTRTAASFAGDVHYIVDTYGSHPAMYTRQSRSGSMLPVFYIYDSYLVNATHWAEIFRAGFSTSLRGTKYDGIFLGLVVERQHQSDVARAGFDGFYTYFASNGFTYGSTWTSWKPLQGFAHQKRLLFVPSVGPGYVDTRVRPWNGINTKWRENGGYYESALKAALSTNPSLVSITSFNEWHEGTQIESAVPHRYGNFTYQDYSPNQPDYYLRLTRQYVEGYKPTR